MNRPAWAETSDLLREYYDHEWGLPVRDTPGAGAQEYTLRYSTEIGFGGTSTLMAAASRPLRIFAVEV